MAKTHRIEASQFVILMVVCRFFSFVSFIQSGWTVQKGTAEFVGVFIGSLATIVLLWPVFLILRDGQNIITFTAKTFPRLTNFICIFYWITIIYYAIDCVTHFNFFMMASGYPNAPVLLLLLVFLTGVAYFSSLGIEPIARASWFFFIMIVIGLVTITITLIPKINMVNFVSPIYEGFGNMLYTAYLVICRNAGLVVLLIMAGNVKGNIFKAYVWYAVIIIITAALISFLTVTVLGEYASTKPFATYTLASVAEFTFLKRLDSIHLYIWIFCSIIKSSAFIFLAQVCMEKFFNLKYKKYYLLINLVVVGGCSYVLLSDIKYFNMSYNFINTGIVQLSSLYIMPALLLFFAKIKGKKAKKLAK